MDKMPFMLYIFPLAMSEVGGYNARPIETEYGAEEDDDGTQKTILNQDS